MSYLGTQPNDVKKNTGLYTPSEILQLEKDGHWGGSLELIAEETISSATVVDFLNIQENKFDVHYLTYDNVLFANETSFEAVSFQLYESGVLETASVYQYAQQYGTSGGTFGENKSTGTASILVSIASGNTTPETSNGYIYFYNLGNSAKYSFATFHNTQFSTGSNDYTMTFGGAVLPQASAVDGIRFKSQNTANLTQGTIKLYGVKQIWVT